MKKFAALGLIALMALSTVTIGAEGDKPGKKRPDAKKRPDGKKGHDGRHGEIFSKLDLSDDQKAELAEIRKEFGPKFKEAREDKNREAYGKLREEMIAAVQNVLTDEQRAKLKKLREAHGDRGDKKGKGKGKGKGKRPEKGAEG